MAVINNQYPAPLIEAYQGDTLVITVNNHLDIPQAIHWHGMRQNGTNWADGVPGISQCGIPPGSSFTYRFKLDTEVGTYWYHSHYSNTMADGITGGLIVYANNQPYRRGRDYDAERVLYLNDWMNDDSEIIAQGLLDLSKGYRGSAIPPDPDAVLINGLGQSDCDVAQLGVKCISQKPYVMKANYGNKVRLRLINMGSHAVLRFSIDNHELQLIEIDDTSIQAINVHEVTLAPGQRASVIVRLNRGNIGSAFWMRATTASGCMNPLHVITTKAILWYSSFFGTLWSSGIPNTQPWGDLADAAYAPCRDTDEEHTVIPMEKEDSPATAIQAGMMDSSFGRFVHPDGTPFIGFGYNEVSFINYINNPLLSQVEKGSQLNPKHVASLTFNSPSNKHAIDFIVNNLDPVGLTHPFHLHGRPFHIIHRGKGKLTPDMISSLTLNTANPPRRDTLTIGGGEHVLLRIITDTPGVWPIHCHIGWHLATGKLGVFVIRPDVVATFTQPAEWSNLCNGLDPNEIGPARRTLPPQSRANSWSDEPEEYAGGVQDFTPTPEGASRREYRANGTHWWVDGTEYAGEIAGEHQSPDKRGLLEARTVFMNATDWWIPGTVFHGKLETPINVEEQAATAFKSEEDSNLVIVTPDLIVPGPGDALVENTEIINGTLVETEVTTFENLVPVGYTAAAPDPKETGKSAL
jgi:FtsP/CotA-like multicopper oxidase with cupredoxin domain